QKQIGGVAVDHEIADATQAEIPTAALEHHGDSIARRTPVRADEGAADSHPARGNLREERCALRSIAARGNEWRGERARGEEGRWNQPPPLLLLQDAELHPPEARATIVLRDREPRPAELGHGAPELQVVADRLIESGAQLCAAGALAEQSPGALTDQLLFFAMGKLHARTPPRGARRGVFQYQ